MKTFLLSILLVIIGFTGANSQQVSSHPQWTKEDSAAINALALYPDSVRREIFTACEYPSVIVNVASLQKNSSSAFADLVSSYSKTKQEDVWNLSRYPNLIYRLVDGGKKSKEDIETILSVYPAEVHDMALKYGRDEYDLLKKVNDLQLNTNQQFNGIVAAYPADVQKTFADLLAYPEVMSLLNDHLNLSVRVGDRYKSNPELVMHKSDSIAAVQATINAQQLQDWKQNLQQDSNARNELKNAANEYATNNGYNQNDVDAPMDSTDINSGAAVYPYSYWFGYPTWYPYDYWYPYPYWYDWGFYYGPYGNMVVFGFPSYYFTNWYFCYPHHWRDYPHLGSAYIHHYYGQHRLNTLSRQVVHNWVHANKSYFPSDFIKNDATRVNIMKQFGELNEKVANKAGIVKPAERDAYLAKNAAKYPLINNSQAQAKMPDEKQGADVREPYVRQPVVVPQRSETQSQRVQPQRATQQNTPQPQYNYNNIQRAQSYHTNTWQQAAPAPAYHAPVQQQPERQYSAPAPAPAPARPSSGGGGERRR